MPVVIGGKVGCPSGPVQPCARQSLGVKIATGGTAPCHSRRIRPDFQTSRIHLHCQSSPGCDAKDAYLQCFLIAPPASPLSILESAACVLKPFCYFVARIAPFCPTYRHWSH